VLLLMQGTSSSSSTRGAAQHRSCASSYGMQQLAAAEQLRAALPTQLSRDEWQMPQLGDSQHPQLLQSPQAGSATEY
jgi:hypothetical protein